MPRYKVYVPVEAVLEYVLEADSPQHAQGKMVLHVQTGQTEAQFVGFETTTTTQDSADWRVVEKTDE